MQLTMMFLKIKHRQPLLLLIAYNCHVLENAKEIGAQNHTKFIHVKE